MCLSCFVVVTLSHVTSLSLSFPLYTLRTAVVSWRVVSCVKWDPMERGKLGGWHRVSEKAALYESHRCEDVRSARAPGVIVLPGLGLFVPPMRTAKGGEWKLCPESQRPHLLPWLCPRRGCCSWVLGSTQELGRDR